MGAAWEEIIWLEGLEEKWQGYDKNYDEWEENKAECWRMMKKGTREVRRRLGAVWDVSRLVKVTEE